MNSISSSPSVPPISDNCNFTVELTDTFGGEANYSWVKRKTFEAPRTISDRALVRRAKALIGLQGRHIKSDLGETIELRFAGQCIVCFITPEY